MSCGMHRLLSNGRVVRRQRARGGEEGRGRDEDGRRRGGPGEGRDEEEDDEEDDEDDDENGDGPLNGQRSTLYPSADPSLDCIKAFPK